MEVDVIGTRAFQRLRNVLHLGLAHLVFPAANFNRFSHSVGTCHVAGRILAGLNASDNVLDDDQVQTYRLAALCHDIGHYPYSHPVEHGLKAEGPKDLIVKAGQQGTDDPLTEDEQVAKHEAVVMEVLRHDVQLADVWARHGINPKDIERVFNRKDPGAPLTNLISSDLDADRLDYLSRAAHHTGLPFAHVDLDYLIEQMRLDKQGNICLDRSALRAADHALVGRYFDYQQVVYHKTVAGMEHLLKEATKDLVRQGKLDGSRRAIRQMIITGEWSDFDDYDFLRRLREGAADGFARICVDALVNRRPPCLIATYEHVDKEGELWHQIKTRFEELARKWTTELGLMPGRIFSWSVKQSLTKARAHATPEEATDNHDAATQAVRIFDRETQTSHPILSAKGSLMPTLGDRHIYIARLYAHTDEENRRAVLELARKDLKRDLERNSCWVRPPHST